MSRLTVDWLWLLALTAAGFWLAEHRAPVPATWLGLAGVTVLKGRWIIDRFMGLQTAVPWLRWTARWKPICAAPRSRVSGSTI